MGSFWHSNANVVLVLSETVLVLVIEATMTEHLFDNDRLDVYRLSIEYVANAFDTSRLLSGLHRHAESENEFRAQIQAGADSRNVDSDGNEIRWCLGIPERVYSWRRLRARAPRC